MIQVVGTEACAGVNLLEFDGGMKDFSPLGAL